MGKHTTIVLAIGITVLIAFLSLLPGEPLPGDRDFSWLIALTPALVQKPMHIVFYASLVVLWARVRSGMPLSLVAGLAIAYGALLEAAQTYVPGRYGSLIDVLLNSAGVWVGVVLTRQLLRAGLKRH